MQKFPKSLDCLTVDARKVYLLKMSWTSTVSSMDLTRVHRERLMAAGNSEMRVCGVLDSLYTYNGKTKIMHGLVTPDLSGEIIVSRFDAERVGAIKIDRSDAKVSILTNAPKRKSETNIFHLLKY